MLILTSNVSSNGTASSVITDYIIIIAQCYIMHVLLPALIRLSAYINCLDTCLYISIRYVLKHSWKCCIQCPSAGKIIGQTLKLPLKSSNDNYYDSFVVLNMVGSSGQLK